MGPREGCRKLAAPQPPHMNGPDKSADLRPWGLLAAASGMVLAMGLFAAFARTSFPEIAAAPNPLGIVSRTTEIGYPTRRDVAILGSGILATLGGAALATLLWRSLGRFSARLLGASVDSGLRGVAVAF